MAETGADLIRLALLNDGEHESAIAALQSLDNAEALDEIWRLCASDNPAERKLGIEILGKSVAAGRLAPERAVAEIQRFLEQEQDAAMLASAMTAAGAWDDLRLLAALLRLKQHPDPSVRFGVAVWLLTRTEVESIATLIELSRDEASNVRNWATFGLGRQIDTDSDEIRAALLARLDDADEETRGEALAGLARRGDTRVIEPLLHELTMQGDDVQPLTFDATVEIGQRSGDQRIYANLLRLQDYEADVLEAEKLSRALRYQREELGSANEE